MALHSTMYSEWPVPSKPWVYLAYVYHYISSAGCSGSGPNNFKTKIVSYDYDGASYLLSNEKIIIDSLNGSNDHNSGRLAGKLVLKGSSSNNNFSFDIKKISPGIYSFKLYNAYDRILTTEKAMIY
ncbi:MAG: hypothetical protein ABI683_05200 [Ginsengibacter sp.]